MLNLIGLSKGEAAKDRNRWAPSLNCVLKKKARYQPEGRASVVQMVRVVAHPNCDILLDLLINADAGMRRHSVPCSA